MTFLHGLGGGDSSTAAAPAPSYGPPGSASIVEASPVPIYGPPAPTPATPPQSSYGPPAAAAAASGGPPAGDSGYIAVQSPYGNMMMQDTPYGAYGGGMAPYYAAPTTAAPAAAMGMSMGGAMTFLTGAIMLIAMLKSQMQSSKRKKRQVGLGGMFTPEGSVFYKILSDLDQEDCIANAICSASSFDLVQNERNKELLDSLGIEKGVPVSWNDMSDVKSKFQYAAFIGDNLRHPHFETGCKSAFPKCNMPSGEVLGLLTNEIKSCDTMITALERLWPEGFEEGRTLRKRSSTVKKAHEGRKLTIPLRKLRLAN